jgi:hypothetical protein
VIIKSKLISEGFKIWAVAEAGYFLMWLPHLLLKVFDFVGDERLEQKEEGR